MFENLSERLNRVVKSVTGKGRLTEKNIQETLREIRVALLEADVALEVIKPFIEQIRERALGQEVLESLTPGQSLVKVVNEALQQLMGEASESLDLSTAPPAVVLMAGLQGSGKTTSVAKLAKYLKEQEQKNPLLVSTDVYRPAAILQLETLAKEIDVAFCPASPDEKPLAIAARAIEAARVGQHDVLLIDTAGRLHIDAEMMDEIRALHQATHPIETLFVVDAMTGQDAAKTAKAFNDALALTGVILTKMDGDARGGAALSVRYLTGKPIKFIGSGEKVDALEAFHPDRMASRILGMGDVMSLIEEAERKLDKKKAEKIAKKVTKGKSFDLEDFREQLLEMNKMGSISGLLDKLPGMGAMKEAALNQVNDKKFGQMVAMINSMTPKERAFPQAIRGSQKRRIAGGSGTQIQDVNRLLKQFAQMQKMMKKMTKKGGMQQMMRQMQGMMPPGGGNLPPFD